MTTPFFPFYLFFDSILYTSFFWFFSPCLDSPFILSFFHFLM
jgi:hypothetical protein